jgi:hypothetical protein
MGTIIAVVTTVVALASVVPALAQEPRIDDAVRSILDDAVDPIRTVRGEVVRHREATLLLLGEDGRTYAINTAGLDTAAMARLTEGRSVMVALKSGRPGAMPIAASVEAIEPDPAAAPATGR